MRSKQKSPQWHADKRRHREKKRQQKIAAKRIHGECERKRAYASSAQALAYASKWRREFGVTTLHAYECEWCGSWHLTRKKRTG